MRLGWSTSKNSVSYYAQKTVYVDGKNKSKVVKRFGSEKYICETYGVTDAKVWAKEQVRLMNEAEKEDAAKFNIELCAGTDLVMDEQRRFNGGYLFLQDVYYELDEDVEVSNVTINVNAFVGCAQFVKIHTSYNYAVYALANDGEPLNAKFDFAPEAYTIKTVADKGNTSIAYNKFNVPYNGGTGYSYEIDPADVAGVYSIYVDESIAYFQSLRKHNGKYVVTPGDCVIIKTEGEKEVEATRTEDNFKCSLIDEVFTLEEDITLAAFQADVVDNPSYLSSYGGWYNDDSSNALKSAGYPDNGMSLYRLTNTAGAGFGFTRYTGTTLKAEQFFILADAPEAARLQTVWLDENGNVEGEATAIQKVETAAENVGEIYNLQGVRVNGAQKGLYIQNGKKFIVK